MARFDRLLDDVGRSLQSRESTGRRWSTVRKRCGYTRMPTEVRSSLQEALIRAGLYPRPRLDGRTPRAEDWIAFSYEPYRPSELGPRFMTERALGTFLEENLTRYEEFRDIERVFREHTLRNGSRVDLLAVRRKGSNRTWIGIELEREDGKDETPHQLLKYLRQLRREHPADHVEGIVISQRENEGAAQTLVSQAQAEGFEVRWLCTRYELDDVTPR